jgi:hypothetical protein
MVPADQQDVVVLERNVSVYALLAVPFQPFLSLMLEESIRDNK